ncbi:hypothetical protein F7725_005065 [Dissostichus mawsoni]|uniref:Ig-like domain-containing protein n=1 Tax=Dissostichus mawsoni TaxID=36200 RepID=A0A7J5XKW6_DISMA|nr:hypothetical protein F7725_005065 [Dissostichus mawsoni]
MKGMKNRICFLSSLMSDIIYRSQSVNIIFHMTMKETLQEKHQLTFRDGQMDGAHKPSHVSLPAIVRGVLPGGLRLNMDTMRKVEAQYGEKTTRWRNTVSTNQSGRGAWSINIIFKHANGGTLQEKHQLTFRDGQMDGVHRLYHIVAGHPTLDFTKCSHRPTDPQEREDERSRDDPTEDPNHITPEVVQWHSPEVVGKWCALVYDHIIYTGIIQEVNETHCQSFLSAALMAALTSAPLVFTLLWISRSVAALDNKSMERYQHPRYRGRVELKDPDMKNGDASVLLKNVSKEDSGTYECWVTSYDMVESVNSVHLTVSEDSEVKAKPGEDVTLQCNSSRDAAVTDLMWNRPDREDDYVFFFRDNRLYEQYQDPRYRGRVELKDPEMKNGEFSILLKKVSVNDSGTYECWVQSSSMRRLKKVLMTSVQLSVSEGSRKPVSETSPRGEEEASDGQYDDVTCEHHF